jgi:hypothetical protein
MRFRRQEVPIVVPKGAHYGAVLSSLETLRPASACTMKWPWGLRPLPSIAKAKERNTPRQYTHICTMRLCTLNESSSWLRSHEREWPPSFSLLFQISSYRPRGGADVSLAAGAEGDTPVPRRAGETPALPFKTSLLDAEPSKHLKTWECAIASLYDKRARKDLLA